MRPLKNTSVARTSRQTTVGGAARRETILEAVLRVISRDGIRAVKHRAVALEAEVPLAATTYYFSSLQDLLSEGFIHWNLRIKSEVDRFSEAAQAVVGSVDSETLQSDPQRKKVAEAVCELTINYLIRQAGQGRDDRNIESAFRHEALRDNRLRDLVVQQDQLMLAAIVNFNRKLRTVDPSADAEISLAIFLHLEQQALMSGLDSAHIRRVVTRHFSQLTGVSL
ncbi:MAG: DNA-binding transcriptional regulator YbjK [Halieaceae bacterium]